MNKHDRLPKKNQGYQIPGPGLRQSRVANNMRALILQSEPDFAEQQRNLLQTTKTCQDVDILHSLAAFASSDFASYELVILDAHLADGSAFEALDLLPAQNRPATICWYPESDIGLAREGYRHGADYCIEWKKDNLDLLPEIATKAAALYLSRRRNSMLLLQLREADAVATLGRMTSGIAHDFNNILQAIWGNAVAGIESNSADEQREVLVAIKKSCEQGQKISNLLLDLVRSRARKKQPCDVREILDNALQLMKYEFLNRNIKIEKSYAAVPDIYCDPPQMLQVFLNLLANARDAISDRGGYLTVTLQADGGNLHIRFSDNGSGIAENIRQRIFEPLFTTKTLEKENRPRGTGMGLFIASEIVQGHNGNIEVDSEVGVGTTFTITLPIEVATTASDSADAGKKNNQAAGKPEKLRILIVEDEEIVRNVLRRMLKVDGHEVSLMPSGQEALEQLRNHDFDLVISDLHMPEMNGMEFLKKARELRDDIKVVMITGDALNPDLEIVEEAGAAGYLLKPFRKKELDSLLKNTLHLV